MLHFNYLMKYVDFRHLHTLMGLLCGNHGYIREAGPKGRALNILEVFGDFQKRRWIWFSWRGRDQYHDYTMKYKNCLVMCKYLIILCRVPI